MNTVHGSRAALVGAVLLLASGCAAAGGYSVTSVGPPRPLREVLPNGVVLIAQEHRASDVVAVQRSEEHTSELQSQSNLVCRLLLEKTRRDHAAPRGGEPQQAQPHRPPPGPWRR